MDDVPSLLDYATQLSSELQESLSLASSDEQKDDIILAHIKKLSSAGTSVLVRDEVAEWVTGFVKNKSLSWFCNGRVALLDFFTYCCINCQHVLPDLKDLEQIYSGDDGFVVVGVHSAKFEAERDPENVSYAAQRLGVSHPILNDPKAELWNRLGIHCWPTLLLLDPAGKPILVLAGEGHRDILFSCVSVAIKHFREAGELQRKFVPPAPTPFLPATTLKNNLRFPGKIVLNPFVKDSPSEPWMTVSDSGNNRIILADSEHNVVSIIGNLQAGLRDGSFQEARFNNPQGVCWLDSDSFIVCDTGNHLLRKVNLESKTVETFAGTGVQTEFGDQGGLKFCQQSISSPWDIVLYTNPDMDMSVRLPGLKKGETAEKDSQKEGDSKDDELRRVLLIASAGSHQIWALFLDTTVWWKYKTYTEGTLMAIVGSGREENRNNRYPNAAGLAQPSGLSLSRDLLFIADSESSTVRRLDLATGQLHPAVGGDRNPCNLFAYGDLDGVGFAVRLQHPLGVACCPISQTVFIADSYNHKIKQLDWSSLSCTTIFPFSSDSPLSEPGGLCISPSGTTLYIADTNNSKIVSVNLNSKTNKDLKLKFPQEVKGPVKREKPVNPQDCITSLAEFKVCSLKGSKLILNLDCNTEKGEKNLHLTPDAPQRWSVKFFHTDSNKLDLINEWEVVRGVRDGKELPGRFEATLKSGFVPKNADRKVTAEFNLSLCEGSVCFVRRFSVHFLLMLKQDFSKKSQYDIKCTIAKDIKISVENEAQPNL